MGLYRRVFGTLAGVDTVWLDYMHVGLIVSAISLSNQEHRHNYLHLWTALRVTQPNPMPNLWPIDTEGRIKAVYPSLKKS